MLWITLVLFIVGGAIAEVHFPGPCPAVVTVANFNVVRYMKKWYEAEKYLLPSKVGKKCVTAYYELQNDGTIKMNNTEITNINKPFSVIATAKISDYHDRAKWTIKYFSTSDFNSVYWVLGTDYEHWAVVWSCANVGGGSTSNPRILTRERYPQNWELEEAYKVLKKNKIERTYFRRTIHTTKYCPEFY